MLAICIGYNSKEYRYRLNCRHNDCIILLTTCSFFLYTEFDDPHSVIVLAEEEIVAIDLTSEGWPTFRQPYLASLHSSAITTATHVANVPDALWTKIVDAGDAQMANQSTGVSRTVVM